MPSKEEFKGLYFHQLDLDLISQRVMIGWEEEKLDHRQSINKTLRPTQIVIGSDWKESQFPPPKAASPLFLHTKPPSPLPLHIQKEFWTLGWCDPDQRKATES